MMEHPCPLYIRKLSLLVEPLSDWKMHKRTERGVPVRIVGRVTLTKIPAGV